MQIVIEINDKTYERIKYLEPKADTLLDSLMRAIQNGKPLPKGHGKLGDLDKLEREMYHEAFETDTDLQKWDSGCWIRYKMFENAIANASIIIEAEEG